MISAETVKLALPELFHKIGVDPFIFFLKRNSQSQNLAFRYLNRILAIIPLSS